ncbi:MAG: choice-of-anchor J domain-containing protein [Bacteroidales bacterium]|nr:choice-of-anchor J domain-containing protein [Bacteroidales bacterium]
MRKFTILFAMILVAGTVFGQYYKADQIKKSTAKETTHVSKNTAINSNEAKAVTFLETFDTWPPTGWTIIDGPASLGTQHWYDGVGYAAIAWDNSGDETARPQDEWMITPEITLPATAPVFSFQFHSNPYWMSGEYNNADLLVKISTDGGTTWTELWNENDYTWEYSVWTEVILPMTTYAGQNVKFAIQYVGTDACWVYIDNVTVYSPDAYDVNLSDARVDYWPLYSNYGYSGFFGQIPFDQISNTGAPVYFSGIIQNRGSETVTPEMTISVLDPTETEVFTGTVPVQSAIAFSQSDTSFIEDPYFTFGAGAFGTYTFNFDASIPGQTDVDLTNNSRSFTTEITHNVYSHDFNNYTTDFSTCLYDGDFADNDVIGVIYQFFATTQVNHMSLFIPEATEVGTSFYVSLMTENGEFWDGIVSSSFVEIEDASQVGMWYDMTFTDAHTIEVPEGEIVEVLAAVVYQTANGTKEFYVGSDATVPTMGFETKMYFAAENKWYYYGGSSVPMIRLNVGIPSGIESNIVSNVSVYPNPTTGIVSVSNVENATIEVINLMGQVVATVNSNTEINSIDLSNEANGTYFVRVVKGNEVSTSKINLVK